MNHTIANSPRSSVIGGAGAGVGTRTSVGAIGTNWGTVISSTGTIVNSYIDLFCLGREKRVRSPLTGKIIIRNM